MKPYLIEKIGLISAGFFLLNPVAAARGPGNGPMHGGMHAAAPCHAGMGAQAWDRASLQNLEGRIKDIKTDSTCMRNDDFLSLQITVEGKDYLVRLGPARFVNSKKLGLALGADVRIKGQPIAGTDANEIIAAEVTIKGQTVKLRDDEGRPLWSRRAKGGVS